MLHEYGAVVSAEVTQAAVEEEDENGDDHMRYDHVQALDDQQRLVGHGVLVRACVDHVETGVGVHKVQYQERGEDGEGDDSHKDAAPALGEKVALLGGEVHGETLLDTQHHKHPHGDGGEELAEHSDSLAQEGVQVDAVEKQLVVCELDYDGQRVEHGHNGHQERGQAEGLDGLAGHNDQ